MQTNLNITPPPSPLAGPLKKPGRGASTISRQRFKALALFARNFFKHPRMLGWFLPSSPFLASELLKPVDWQNARVLIEYGPGTGVITMEILKRMRPDAVLLAIEMNAELVGFLRSTIHDSRLRLIHGSAANARKLLADAGFEKADYVVSGIPFKLVPEKARDEIVRTTHALLAPSGTFLVYQFSNAILPDLQRIFGTVRRAFQPLNILPARLYFCTP